MDIHAWERKHSYEEGSDWLMSLAFANITDITIPQGNVTKITETATSRVGARGLMQIIPDTGREIAEALGESFSEERLYDPEVSIRYGCYYLREQMDRFDQNEAVTLAAYNAGPHRAELWIAEYGLNSKGHIRYIPFGETDRYVDRVLQAKENYANLYEKELAIDGED